MYITVVENHLGEGVFPLFKKGESVVILEDCSFYINWQKCIINNITTYVPKHFVDNNILLVDYNPTELVCNVNDSVEVLDIVYGWVYGKVNNQIGWIPCHKTISSNIFNLKNPVFNK